MIQESQTHPTNEAIADYVRGVLSEPERARITLHIESCEQCQQATEDLRLLLAGLDQESRDHVPEHVLVQYQMAKHPPTDGTVVDEWSLERVRYHISYCEECRADLRLLRELDKGRRQAASSIHPQPMRDLEPNLCSPSRQWRTTSIVPVAIAALLTIMIVTQAPEYGRLSAPTWKTVAQEIPLENLIPLSLRSSRVTDTTVGSLTAEQAALAEFRKLLHLTKDGVRPIESRQSAIPASQGRVLWAVLRTTSGASVDTIVRVLPDSLTTGVGRTTAWLLTMPARELRSTAMRSDFLEVVVQLQPGEFIGFAWTYESGRQHFGLPAHMMSHLD